MNRGTFLALLAPVLFGLLGWAQQPHRERQGPGRLPVVVLDTEGKPIRGVSVTLYRLADGEEKKEVSVGFTDADGAASIAVEEPGDYEVRAFLDGFLGACVGSILVSADERASTRLVVPVVLTLNPVVFF